MGILIQIINKYFLFILFSFLCIFFYNNAYAELKGPIIMGFQLGMTHDQVNKIVDKLKIEDGYTLEKTSTIGLHFNYALKKDDDNILMFYIDNNELLSQICYEGRAFNVSDISDQFIRDFMKHYNIIGDDMKLTADGLFPGLNINDYKEGYKIVFGKSSILLCSIKKQKPKLTGPAQFK